MEGKQALLGYGFSSRFPANNFFYYNCAEFNIVVFAANLLRITGLTYLFIFSFPVLAQGRGFEAYNAYPGTRAMSMAGAFSAQANDSSAVWHNPAGLKQTNMSATEFTLEVGDVPNDNSGKEYVDTGRIKFMGWHTDHLPFSKKHNEFGLGLGLYTPFHLTAFINEPLFNGSEEKFGDIDIIYQQYILAAAYALSSRLSVGGSLDVIATNIDCRNYASCVENGPLGIGGSLGVIYKWLDRENLSVKVGGTWRARARINYSEVPERGIGHVLHDYVPDRPEIRNLGVHISSYESWGVVNTNFIYEQTLWANAIKKVVSDKEGSDYHRFAVSNEILFPRGQSNSWALRTGISSSQPQNKSLYPVINAVTMGSGLSFARTHFIDFGIEYRVLSLPDNPLSGLSSQKYEGQFVSLSYSWQP